LSFSGRCDDYHPSICLTRRASPRFLPVSQYWAKTRIIPCFNQPCLTPCRSTRSPHENLALCETSFASRRIRVNPDVLCCEEQNYSTPFLARATQFQPFFT